MHSFNHLISLSLLYFFLLLYRIIVGAPLAQNQDLRSGAVYKCKLSTTKNDCVPLRIDQDDKNQYNAIKDNQWLGVIVKSQGPGGYVMTCAHRYILNGTGKNHFISSYHHIKNLRKKSNFYTNFISGYQWGQGICYSLTQHLSVNRAWEPWYVIHTMYPIVAKVFI